MKQQACRKILQLPDINCFLSNAIKEQLKNQWKEDITVR